MTPSIKTPSGNFELYRINYDSYEFRETFDNKFPIECLERTHFSRLKCHCGYNWQVKTRIKNTSPDIQKIKFGCPNCGKYNFYYDDNDNDRNCVKIPDLNLGDIVIYSEFSQREEESYTPREIMLLEKSAALCEKSVEFAGEGLPAIEAVAYSHQFAANRARLENAKAIRALIKDKSAINAMI